MRKSQIQASARKNAFARGIGLAFALATVFLVSGQLALAQVTNGDFSAGSTGWTNVQPSGGSMSYTGGELRVVGDNDGSGSNSTTYARQTISPADPGFLSFLLRSYSSSDNGDYDWPMVYINGTNYRIRTDGTLATSTPSINNANPATNVTGVTSLSSGSNTIGFGVLSEDAQYGAGIAVWDDVEFQELTQSPSAQSVDEDSNLTLSGASALQVATNSNLSSMSVSLQVSNGTLTLSTLTGITITAGGNGTSTMTFNGTPAAINTALDGLIYTPDPDYSGSDTLVFSVTGSPISDADNIAITVNAMPDIVNCPTGSTATGSGYASSGSGQFREEVFWLDWNCGSTVEFAAGDTINKSWILPSGMIITAQLANITSALVPYNTGNWGGDMLDNLYGGINPIGLQGAANSVDPDFTIAFNATLDGVSVPMPFVVADAEDTSSSNESIAVTTSGSAWSIIETAGTITSTLSNGNLTITHTEPGNAGGGTTLSTSVGSPTFTFNVEQGGLQAIAVGTRLTRDFSDAPLSGTSYAGASHRALSTYRLGAAVTEEQLDYDDANAAGDADDGVTIPSLVQAQAATVTALVTGSAGYLQAWFDWNGDGDFADAGEQVASNVQDGGAGDGDAAANGVISLAVTPPATATTSQTFGRFRWSRVSGEASSGAGNFGEIEDYAVSVAAANPSLSVVKSANDTTDVTLNQVITYTYVVTNNGNQTVTDISLGDVHNGSGPDPTPGGENLTNDVAPLNDSTDGGTNGTWDNLAPGDSVTFTATYSVTQSDIDSLQ